jgi:hypothetical protein
MLDTFPRQRDETLGLDVPAASRVVRIETDPSAGFEANKEAFERIALVVKQVLEGTLDISE